VPITLSKIKQKTAGETTHYYKKPAAVTRPIKPKSQRRSKHPKTKP